MNDDQILQRGGTEEDIIKYAENNGADLNEALIKEEITSEVSNFKRELASVLNKYSRENLSNTPDYILAEYLNDCLNTFDKIIQLRKNDSEISPEDEKNFYKVVMGTKNSLEGNVHIEKRIDIITKWIDEKENSCNMKEFSLLQELKKVLENSPEKS